MYAERRGHMKKMPKKLRTEKKAKQGLRDSWSNKVHKDAHYWNKEEDASKKTTTWKNKKKVEFGRRVSTYEN